jgi:NADH-quinone oxidoreductase subunit L
MAVPLIALAALSVVGGFIELPRTLGNLPLFTGFLRTALPGASPKEAPVATEGMLQLASLLAATLGLCLAYVFFLWDRGLAGRLARSAPGAALHRFWFSGWGFDTLYDRIFVKPFLRAAEANRDDFIDTGVTAFAGMNIAFHRALSLTQTGQVRWYAMGIVVGAIVAIAIAVLL